MNNLPKNSWVLLLLPFLGIVLHSCKKDELLSVESIYRLKIDTLFYTPTDLQGIYIIKKNRVQPLLVDSDLVVVAGTHDQQGKRQLVRIDGKTGEILWSWREDIPFRSISYSGNNILVVGYNILYLINPETGQTTYSYSPPSPKTLVGADIFEEGLYLCQKHNDNYRLFKTRLDGSEEVPIYEVSKATGFVPTALAPKVLTGTEGHVFLTWQVPTHHSSTNLQSMFVWEIYQGYDHGGFWLFDVGRKPTNNQEETPLLIDHRSFFACGGDGGLKRVESGNLLEWQTTSSIKEGSLFANNSNLYVSGEGFEIFDKRTGKSQALIPDAFALAAVTNSVLITSSYRLNCYDPNTGELLVSIEKDPGHVASFVANEDESTFYFTDYFDGGRLGKIHLTVERK